MPLSSPARAVSPCTWHSSAVALAVALSASSLAAAADSDGPSVDEVVITAARVPEVRSSVSQSIGVLNADEIAREAARTPNQMLSEQVGIWTPQTATQGSPI